jgi:hypothetical protein
MYALMAVNFPVKTVVLFDLFLQWFVVLLLEVEGSQAAQQLREIKKLLHNKRNGL